MVDIVQQLHSTYAVLHTVPKFSMFIWYNPHAVSVHGLLVLICIM